MIDTLLKIKEKKKIATGEADRYTTDTDIRIGLHVQMDRYTHVHLKASGTMVLTLKNAAGKANDNRGPSIPVVDFDL